MRKYIEVIVDTEGNSVVTVCGAKGSTCKELTSALEKQLGDTVKSSPTGEMYESQTEHRVEQRGE